MQINSELVPRWYVEYDGEWYVYNDGKRINQLETDKDTFHFRVYSCQHRVSIDLCNKVNRSHINEVESNNEVNFQQEEIKVPTSILNKSVKGIKLEQITGRSKDFSSKAKGDWDFDHIRWWKIIECEHSSIGKGE